MCLVAGFDLFRDERGVLRATVAIDIQASPCAPGAELGPDDGHSDRPPPSSDHPRFHLKCFGKPLGVADWQVGAIEHELTQLLIGAGLVPGDCNGLRL